MRTPRTEHPVYRLTLALLVVLATLTLTVGTASGFITPPKNGNHTLIADWRHDCSVRNADYMNALEKEIVLHLNMARTDPVGYARKYIEPRLRYFKGNVYHDPSNPHFERGQQTHEGKRAVRECISGMQSARPAKALYPSKEIFFAAQAHARHLSRTGKTGHNGPDGSKPATRLRRFGRWKITGENISYGLNAGPEIVISLLVDDGVRNRGHRDIILDPGFSIVGVAIERHPVHRYVCVIDFVGGNTGNAVP